MGSNTGRGWSTALLPGHLRVDLRPGDSAVYIGTIQYFRDEFFEITRLVIKDDYERARAGFTKKFGNRVALRRALATRVR